MNIFIDTAVFGCNIALFDDQKIIDFISEPIERGHAETLLPMIETLIQKNNKNPQDIENIYTTIGPGSFTGLRVGLSTAQFIGFGLKKPVHGITTFQAFSSAVEGNKNRLILIETKRDDYYVQMMDGEHSQINDPQILTSDKIDITDGVIVTGDAVDRFQSETGFKGQGTNQSMIDPEAVIKAIQTKTINFHPVEPFYIRDADVSQPNIGKR